jgi:exopolyphosphatase/guanosine-5'-triphosphate,3'-diphosphate pyrophosphatase
LNTGEDSRLADAALPAGGPTTGATKTAPTATDAGAAVGDGGQRQGKRKKRRRRKRRPVYASGTAAAAGSSEPPTQQQQPISPAVEPRRPPPAPAAHSPCYAALDLGTNNCRLLVATPRERGFRVVDAFSRIVRLGEGVTRTGRLSEQAMDRAVEALKSCRTKLESRHVTRARTIATEACRLAENRADFVSRVANETGIELEIVSQKTEARLAVAGCASLVDPNASGVILFDIGGGSTELVWIDLTQRTGTRKRIADCIRSWQSMPVGVVTLAEHFGGENVTHAIYDAMVGEVEAKLAAFPQRDALDAAFATGGVHMLGTSGTVTTLAGVHLALPRYDRRRVDGVWLSGSEVTATIADLMAMDYAARVAHPCIGAERADLVIAGCAILDAFRRRWPCEQLRVADRGLREGMLVEMMSEDGVWRRRSPDAQPPGGGSHA